MIERNIRTIIHLQTRDHQLSDLADVEIETKPEDVLAEIEHLQNSESAKGHV